MAVWVMGTRSDKFWALQEGANKLNPAGRLPGTPRDDKGSEKFT